MTYKNNLSVIDNISSIFKRSRVNDEDSLYQANIIRTYGSRYRYKLEVFNDGYDITPNNHRKSDFKFVVQFYGKQAIKRAKKKDNVKDDKVVKIIKM